MLRMRSDFHVREGTLFASAVLSAENFYGHMDTVLPIYGLVPLSVRDPENRHSIRDCSMEKRYHFLPRRISISAAGPSNRTASVLPIGERSEDQEGCAGGL